jgi:hypothetical protein
LLKFVQEKESSYSLREELLLLKYQLLRLFEMDTKLHLHSSAKATIFSGRNGERRGEERRGEERRGEERRGEERRGEERRGGIIW